MTGVCVRGVWCGVVWCVWCVRGMWCGVLLCVCGVVWCHVAGCKVQDRDALSSL